MRSVTYPTFNLRELAKDVMLRLAGKNDKAIRQLELTYGGGKTHTLITLYHLTNTPGLLPVELAAVQEFTQHIGQMPPRARVAVLAFDKLDAEKGMEVQAPNGERRRLNHPWSVLAFQLAGGEGLRILNANDEEIERESAPAEPLRAVPAPVKTITIIDGTSGKRQEIVIPETTERNTELSEPAETSRVTRNAGRPLPRPQR